MRISVTAALTLGLIRRVLPIDVFYWNSGQGRNALPSWSNPMQRVRFELASLPLRIALRLVDRLVTGPERMAAYYTDEYGIPSARIVIVYNDVDPRPFRTARVAGGAEVRAELNVEAEMPILLFVGRVSRLKGGYNLVALCRRLRQRGVRVKCVAVGEVHLPDAQAAAHDADLIDMLQLVGPVPNRDLPRYYAAATLFVLPSESEGFPRVLLEAMAAELPVVAFDVGGVLDILGERQRRYVCARGDVDCLAERIAELLKDPIARSELAQENRVRVELYDTDAAVRMFMDRVVNASL